MSFEIEEQLTVVKLEEAPSTESSKKSVRSYTREFLLSFGELEACKKLPNDFDESLLSEFHGTSYYGSQDRPRVSGNLSLQGFRRSEYGSSPPTRGLDRWDTRSNGKSEGDLESESGRHYGNQGKRTWQNHERDGLLGSGSIPRPPGYTTGSAASRARPNEISQRNKSNEPYQPPRPYKAGPHSWRETKDSFNDETFGSSDFNDEDKAEEEKKRRAEFELMRKEHHKAFQENQKSNSGRPKDSFSEMVGLLENTNDSKYCSDLNRILKEAPHGDAGKLRVSSAPPIRPLVPPGFVGGVVDKSSPSKFTVPANTLQVEKFEVEQGDQNVKSVTQERGSSEWFGEMISSSHLNAQKGLSPILHGVGQATSSTIPVLTSALENGESLGLDSELSGHKILAEPVHSTSILDKLFSNGLTTSCENSSIIVEGDDRKTDDTWSPDKLQSKFTRWFCEEDKTLGHTSVDKPNSLLSSITGGENGGSDRLYDVFTLPTSAPELLPEKISSKSASSNVLTCEDLEQLILSEIGGDNPKSQSVEKEQSTFELKNDGLPRNCADSSASQHLLSLLQKGSSSNNAVSTLGLVEKLPDDDHELGKSGLPVSSTINHVVKELNHSDKSLTLESLFGTAFMTELQSAQRYSASSSKMDVLDGGTFPPKMGENGDEVCSRKGNILGSNDGIVNLDKAANWLDFQDTGKQMDRSRLSSENDAEVSGFDGGIGAKLLEENSLINPVDPINAKNSYWMLNSSSDTSVNGMKKLAALGSSGKDDRSIVGGSDPRFLQSPFGVRNPGISYQNLHFPSSSPQQLHTPPMNHNRTSLHPLDSHPVHIDPHVFDHDARLHHQFPTNINRPSFPHSNAGPTTFDHLVPHPGLQQMHMAGSHPPPHLVRGFRGHTPAGFIQEHNPMQVLPFGPAMMPSGPELVANNPPEAFQRLLEMEMRTNPKQMHPFAAGNPSRPMYEHELDMAYR